MNKQTKKQTKLPSSIFNIIFVNRWCYDGIVLLEIRFHEGLYSGNVSLLITSNSSSFFFFQCGGDAARSGEGDEMPQIARQGDYFEL